MSKVTRSKLKSLIYILLQETNKINRKFFQILNDFLESTLLLYRVFCYTEIEGKDRITRGFRPQKLGITAFFVLSFPPYSLKIFFKIPIRLLHFKRIYAILKRIFGMHYKKH